MNMHTYQHTVQQKKKILQKTLKETQANLEVTQARVQRQKKKIETMHDLLTSLKDKELIATEQQKILDHNFSGIAKKVIESHNATAEVQPNFDYHSDEVIQFAMTLHYYSPKVHEFVHQVWKLSHTSRIQHWAVPVNCEPGYLKDVIKLIGLAAKTDHSMTDAILVVDAMAIPRVLFGIQRTDSMFVM